MNNKTPKPYGTWPGKITPDMVTAKALRFGTLKTSGNNLYWTEGRAQEGGRGVIMRWAAEDNDPSSGTLTEILPPPFSARSKVHEYGGGEFCIAHMPEEGRQNSEDVIFFINSDDQQIYLLKDNTAPEKITNLNYFRFADLEYDHKFNRLIAVAELHSERASNNTQPKNMLVTISLSEEGSGESKDQVSQLSILDDTHDFYASPRISPDGKTIAYLQWDLPNMPWETGTLMTSELRASEFQPKYIAGGEDYKTRTTTACFGPRWDKDDRLYFISDQSGTGQLYHYQNGTITHVAGQDEKADCLRPAWVFGMEAFAIAENNIYLTAFKEGQLILQHITPDGSTLINTTARSIDMPNICTGSIAAITTADETPPSISLIDPATGQISIIRSASEATIDAANISTGELHQFKGPLGTAFGIYYPPTHKEFSGEEANPGASPPPAIITIHGGPTAMVDRGLKLKTQFWTNQGYAVFDVDYAGSSGYGKSYRERLAGGWGEADVDDIIAAAEYLVEAGLTDKEKLILTGGSSGGYTCLMALIKSDLFKCASVNYPVTDLAQLLEITHKFELGYTYGLTGTTPQTAKEKLSNASIAKAISAITTPVIFFQGLEDKVVPPSQPKAVYEALKNKGVDALIFEFEGEGHGFRRGETIKTVLQEEQNFFKKHI